jgi:hypothetical protein
MNPGPSRFLGLRRRYSQLILVLLAALVALISALAPAEYIDKHKSQIQSQGEGYFDAVNSDTELYQRIIARIENGENYYAVATQEQRINGFPTQPFATVRLPTLAVFSAAIGDQARNLIALVLAISVVMVWYRRLAEVIPSPLHRMPLALLALSGFVIFLVPRCLELHDIWAGALIALSIGLYRPERYWSAVFAAAAALAIRELALPFVMLMAAMAFWERRWREGLTWTLVLAAFALALFGHAVAVQQNVQPGDQISIGWVRFGGISTAISALIETSGLLAIVPRVAMPALFLLAIFGWVSWRSNAGLRVSLYILGYCLKLAIIGRPENFYWGFLIAPLLPIGLVFVPRALADLIANLKRGDHQTAA